MVSLSRVGSREIGLQHPQHLPSGPAVVVMEIDGCVSRWEVELLHGAVPFDEFVEISRPSPVEAA